MNNKVIKFIGYIVTLAAFIFLAKSILSMHLNVSRIKSPAKAVAYGLLLSMGYGGIVYVSSWAWKIVLEFIHGDKIPYRDIAGVYAKSNIGKYFPGNFMHFAGRNILAGKLGFNQVDIAFSSIVEILTLIVTAAVWGVVLDWDRFTSILHDALRHINPLLVGGITLFILLACLTFCWLFIIKKGYMQKYRRFLTSRFLRLLAKLFFIYSLTLILPGIFLVLIFTLVLGSDVNLSNALVIVSAYIISWVAGFIVPGAPGGLGVRESILLLILGSLYTNNLALLAALLQRLASILGDAIAFFIVPAVTKLCDFNLKRSKTS